MTKPTVLIVESNPWDRKILTDILGGHQDKFAVDLASSTANAQLILEGKRVDLIVLSSNPLGMRGIDFLRKIRMTKSMKNTPVVFVSAQEDLEEEIESMRAGADLYQSKAFNAGIFIAQIERLLERKRFEWPFFDFLSLKVALSPVEALGALAAVMLVIRIIEQLVP